MKVVGQIKTTISHLEMFAPPNRPPVQPPPGAEVVRALNPTLSFYRYLYDTIGEEWLWSGQRIMDQDKLFAKISDPAVDLRVLWLRGVPAGMAEFDFRDPSDVELLYFGLIPDFVGGGLGRFLIDWSCRHAFHKGAQRFWVHTCDLDHPRALANYEKAGFELFDREEAFEKVLDGMLVPAHAQDRTILPVDANT